MVEAAKAIHQFWNGFGWTAYDENTVPDNLPFPRITYSFSFSEFDNTVQMTASLWDRSSSWVSITEKADEIYHFIGLGGRVISFNGGSFWIKRGTLFAQRMSDEDDSVRRIYLTLETEFFVKD